MSDKDLLFGAIMNFMNDTLYCYNKTAYITDRQAYASDIVLCATWVSKIHNNEDLASIILDILDTSTSKHINDYYKHGEEGDLQAKSFAEFRKTVVKLSGME